MDLRRPLFGLALASVLLVPSFGQDGFDDDFDLDALIEGDLVEEGTDSNSILRGVQGFAETSLRSYLRDRGRSTHDEQWLMKGELELDFRFSDSVSGYARPRFLVDALDGDYERFEPFEGYVTVEGDTWDLRVGSMVENWGIVDTYNPIDVLNRRDFASDLLDADRLGEFGMRWRRSFGGNETFGEPTVSLYALPVWQDTPFATADQRYTLESDVLPFDEDGAFDPSGSERGFYGLRAQSTLNSAWLNADLQASVTDGPTRFPGMHVIGGALTPVYHGARVIGAGIRAVPNEDKAGSMLAKYTFKAEVAQVSNTTFDDAPFAAPDDSVAWVFGVDRTFDQIWSDVDSLTMTVEYAKENGASDAQAALRPFRNDLILRGLWEANDFARTSFEARALMDLDNHELIGELRYERQMRRWHEDLKLGINLQLFDAADADESLFGAFSNNSALMVSLRFDF